MGFRPTRPRAARLLRLGVMLDTRNAPARFREIARMCDRAGVDALWVADPGAAAQPESPRLEAWTALVLAALETSRAQVGAMLDMGLRPAELLASMARTLGSAIGDRLEIGCRSSSTEVETRAVRDCVARLRDRGADMSICIEARGTADLAMAVHAGSDVLLHAASPGALADAVGEVRAACEAAGRDPETLGIAVERFVSVGRTRTEAHARASAGDGFQMAVADDGASIVGTLEECQDRVIELAHAGVTELRCRVPNTPDVHDAIAQLTAMAVGTLGALAPSAPRSAAPAPPEGWGGRSLRP